MLTDRNKEQFEKWLGNSKRLKAILSFINDGGIKFEHTPFEMQWGVYLAYADSLGNPISTDLFDEDEMHYFKIYPSITYSDTDGFDNQEEAQRAALKAFDELINKEL